DSHRDTGAGARAARIAVQPPWVARRRDVDAVCELMGVCLAERDRSGLAQADEDRGVVVGDPALEDARAGFGRRVARVDQVFVCDGYPMERAAPGASRELLIRSLGLRACGLPGDVGIGVDQGLGLLDSLKLSLHEISRRDLTPA